MRTELHPVLASAAKVFETENLIPATVSENRSAPAHELMKSASLFNQSRPWTQVQVIGICEDNFRTDFAQLSRCRGFHRSLCRHGHKCRCRNSTMLCLQLSQTSLSSGIPLCDGKTKHEVRKPTALPHFLGLSGRFSRFSATLQPPLENQHRIAVAIEAIPLSYGLLIGVKNEI